MSEILKELRSLSDEKIIEAHDKLAQHTQVGVNHYLSEIARREQHSQTEVMLRYTKWVVIMTFVITIATIINLVLMFKLPL